MNPVSLTRFSISLGSRSLLRHASFEPRRGSACVITGPTGTGKSVLLKAIAGILPLDIFDFEGDMVLHGIDAYRGGKKTCPDAWMNIAQAGLVFVPAETAQAMNPALTLEQNIKLLAPGMRALIAERLALYFDFSLEDYARLYPDEVSGGELQRVTIMTLLSRQGDLILLDEPTVNLDRNLRRRFADFLNTEILGDHAKTVLMASHDLDFLRGLKMDEYWGLLDGELSRCDSLPQTKGREKAERKDEGEAVIELHDVSQDFFKRGIFGERPFTAFKGVSTGFAHSTVYGITGPSGCGKSSMIKAILRLMGGTMGRITLNGTELVSLKREERGYDPGPFKPFRRRMVVVQQDSRYAFFPDATIRQSFRHIADHGSAKNRAAQAPGSKASSRSLPQGLLENLARVGLGENHLDLYPHSLSSGEMKRMDIARALAAKPDVLLLDEPFAHIDFETRSKVMTAVSDYLKSHETVLLIVTHEDYDLTWFVDEDIDFPSLVQGAPA